MKKFFVFLVVVTVVGSVAPQNSVTENDIIGTWSDNAKIRYVFDSSGTVTITGGVKGVYIISGEELIIAFKNVLMIGTRPMSEDGKMLTLESNSGFRIILTKLD